MARVHDTLSVRHYGASPGGHVHDHFQILIGLDGVLELQVEGRGRRLQPGDGLVIAPNDSHDFEAPGGARCLVLDSHDAAWAGLARTSPPPSSMPLAHYLASACATAQPRAQLLGPALMQEAWASTASLTRAKRAVDWPALQAWAQARAGAPLSVADLANRTHLSTAQFHERCREELGLSPMAWLRDMRLGRARLLRAQGLPVAEVAHRCGYRSPSALTAALRKSASAAPAKRDD